MQLSNEKVEQFWEDGFTIVENLLDPDEVASLLAHAEWVASGEASHIPKGQLQVEPHVVEGKAQAKNYADSLRKMSHLAFYDEGFENHARNPKILDIIESLLGSDIKLYQDQLFYEAAANRFTTTLPSRYAAWILHRSARYGNLLGGTYRFDNRKWVRLDAAGYSQVWYHRTVKVGRI